MTKLSSILIIIIFNSIFAFGQNNRYKEVDQKMLSIPRSAEQNPSTIANYIRSSFHTDEEKLRAAYIWIAKNIEYDTWQLRTSQSEHKTKDRIIRETLRTRKALCDGYAHLFQRISSKLGIKTVVVSGYTKQYEKIDNHSHAWCVTQLNSNWYIMDPTWGSGHLLNRITFVKSVNNTYFMGKPEDMIASHMPFDPMWQCLEYPTTNQDFYDGLSFLDSTKKYFNYKDSIKLHEAAHKTKQLRNSLRRVRENGIKNRFIEEHIRFLENEIEFYQHRDNTDQYNRAIDLYNESAALYNQMVIKFNRQIKNGKKEQNILKDIKLIKQKLNEAKILLQIPEPEYNLGLSIQSTHIAIEELLEKLIKHQRYLRSNK